MRKRTTKAYIMVEEYADPKSDAVVALALHAGSGRSAERWFDNRLKELRADPAGTIRWLEEALLRGLSEVNRQPGPEHSKQTHRAAGGGKLTKGS